MIVRLVCYLITCAFIVNCKALDNSAQIMKDNSDLIIHKSRSSEFVIIEDCKEKYSKDLMIMGENIVKELTTQSSNDSNILLPLFKQHAKLPYGEIKKLLEQHRQDNSKLNQDLLSLSSFKNDLENLSNNNMDMLKRYKLLPSIDGITLTTIPSIANNISKEIKHNQQFIDYLLISTKPLTDNIYNKLQEKLNDYCVAQIKEDKNCPQDIKDIASNVIKNLMLKFFIQ